MIKFLRFLLFIVILSFIFLNVYIATLPSVNKYNYKGECENIAVSSIVSQIGGFQNWKKKKDNNTEKLLISLGREPLLNRLKVILKNGDHFTLENQLISDTLIIQHIYGLGGKKASVLRWDLNGKDCLSLSVKELLGNKQKLLKGLGIDNLKSKYLEGVSKELLNFNRDNEHKKSIKISSLEELEKIDILIKVEKSDTIIRLPKQN